MWELLGKNGPALHGARQACTFTGLCGDAPAVPEPGGEQLGEAHSRGLRPDPRPRAVQCCFPPLPPAPLCARAPVFSPPSRGAGLAGRPRLPAPAGPAGAARERGGPAPPGARRPPSPTAQWSRSSPRS